jgi:hypothetical protein
MADIKLTVTIEPDDHRALAEVLDPDDLMRFWEDDIISEAVVNEVNVNTFAKVALAEGMAEEFTTALLEVWGFRAAPLELAEALAKADEVDLAQIANTLGALDADKAMTLAEALADILGVVA